MTWNKTEEQNARNKGLNVISEGNDISMRENIKTTTMGNRVITIATTTMTNNVNNISSGSNIQGVSSNNLSLKCLSYI